MALLPQHSPSEVSHIKTAYISHQKSLALGGVHSSRAKTIPPDRLIGRKKRLWDGIEFVLLKRIFLGKLGEYLRLLPYANRHLDRPTKPVVQFTQKRRTFYPSLVTYFVSPGGIALVQKIKSFIVFLVFLSYLLFGRGEGGVNGWLLGGWVVFIDRLRVLE